MYFMYRLHLPHLLMGLPVAAVHPEQVQGSTPQVSKDHAWQEAACEST
jgi:hypothetical protein